MLPTGSALRGWAGPLALEPRLERLGDPQQAVVPVVDTLLERRLELREGHGLRDDDVLVQEVHRLLRALEDVPSPRANSIESGRKKAVLSGYQGTEDRLVVRLDTILLLNCISHHFTHYFPRLQYVSKWTGLLGLDIRPRGAVLRRDVEVHALPLLLHRVQLLLQAPPGQHPLLALA